MLLVDPGRIKKCESSREGVSVNVSGSKKAVHYSKA